MFDIEGDKIILDADTLAIPPFKQFYEGSKDKSHAIKIIEYIVWLYKWNTPYLAYPVSERELRVAQDVFKHSFTSNDEVKELVKRYLEFQNTPLTRLYNAAEEGLEYLIDTLEDLKNNSNEGVDLETKLKIAQGVSKILKDVEPTAKSLDSAKKRAIAEQIETGKVKGGGKIGLYELPRS